MKWFKYFLLSCLIIHIYASFLVNLTPLKRLITDKTDLSLFGKWFKEKNTFKYPKPLEIPLNVYSIYTGTNRGYEFFSPNVSSNYLEFEFVQNNIEMMFPLVSQEAQIKLLTAKVFLSSFLFNEDSRKQIMLSIGNRFFIQNSQVNEIQVFLKFTKFTQLKNFKISQITKQEKKVLAFTIRKHE